MDIESAKEKLNIEAQAVLCEMKCAILAHNFLSDDVELYDDTNVSLVSQYRVVISIDSARKKGNSAFEPKRLKEVVMSTLPAAT